MTRHCRAGRIGRALLLSLLLLGGLYAAAMSKAPAPEEAVALSPTGLSPLPEQTAAHREIMQRLQREHLRSIDWDDALAAKLMDRYLDDLDPSRSFLLQADINEFSPYRTTLDEAMGSGDLAPAFHMFNRLQQRRIQRLRAVIKRLEDGVDDMDFTREEVFDTERTEAPWARDMSELDRYWEQRLKLSVLNLLLAGTEPDAARDVVIKRFRNQLRLAGQTNSEDVFQLYMNSVTGCYDPHTQYFSPRTSENFNISMKLSLEGIGAVLSSEDEYTKVISLVPGGPADKAKQLRPADRIVGVGQGTDGEMQDIIGWRLDDVVELIRGPKGTIVRLAVLPAGIEDIHEKREIAIERDTVRLEDQAARKHVLTVERAGRTYTIGVIELPTFYLDFQALHADDPTYKSTSKDIERLLREFASDGIDGLVLDLRNNGGGSLQEAVELTGKFIRYGPVVQTRGPHRLIDVHGDRDYRTSYDGPLLVVVNRQSASASEIVAGALQDYGRAIIFGSRTFGKGTVQSLIPLGHGQLKETLAAYYRVAGEGTQYRGIIPDISYPDLIDPDEIGESSLPDALPWDTIDEISFPRYADLAPALALLRQHHNRRMQTDPDYRYFLALTEHLRGLSARTSVSLCRAEREREQENLKKIRLSLENELRSAKGLPLYESYAELEQAQSDNATEEDTPDPLIDEAAAVLVDYITFNPPAAVPADATPVHEGGLQSLNKAAAALPSRDSATLQQAAATGRRPDAYSQAPAFAAAVHSP